MRPVSRHIRHVLFSTVALLVAAGCSDESTGPSSLIRLRIDNLTQVALTIVVDGPGFNAVTVNLGLFQAYENEVAGEAGDQISVQVTGTGGVSFSGSCAAGSGIVGAPTSDPQAVYGIISLRPPGGTETEYTLECTTGWQ